MAASDHPTPEQLAPEQPSAWALPPRGLPHDLPARLPDGTSALAQLRELRGHATKLAMGLGPEPQEEHCAPAWADRRRGRALFLVGLAEWDVIALRRTLLTVPPAGDPSRMLLLEAIRCCREAHDHSGEDD